jgi:penicillin-binding protein 1B
MDRQWRLLLKIFLTLLVAVGMGLVYLNANLIRQFESLSWAVGAKIFARPLELYQGAMFTQAQVRFELDLLNYQLVQESPTQGQYRIDGNSLWVGMRGHNYPDGKEPDRVVQIDFSKDLVKAVRNGSAEYLEIIRFEPLVLAQLSGKHADRDIVRLSDFPKDFIQMLVAVEDRGFFDHAGISVTGISRAIINNIVAGRFSQGGSTLTQQLVKNLYLTRERTLTRKAIEAVYAILLDARFSKDRILEAYVNEVFLGQWGNRAIHGFGTAAQFFFGKPISELSISQQALLIGLIKGPSVFDPRRFPKRALERRNLVLQLSASQGVISKQQKILAWSAALSVPKQPADRIGRFPGYVEIVRRELAQDYTSEQLTTDGLRVYTALDPQIHRGLDEGRKNALARLKATNIDLQGEVQLGAIMVDIPTGEIQAVVAGRDQRLGFHRVLDARRQIGSLVKPFVVAAAIEQDPRLHAGTLVRDETISIEDDRGNVWTPKNYGEKELGIVRLESVVASSINQATVHLAFGLGLDQILDRLDDLGIPVGPTRPPSTLLGVSEMSPYQVAQRYQFLLNQGHQAPLKAVRTVVDDAGSVLTRRPFRSSRLMTARAAVQVDHMMRVGAKVGTGRAFGQRYTEVMASKTGTTDDGRDAWFVGADGRRLGTVWVGFDDNRKAGLIGSVAALPIISDAFQYVRRTHRPNNLPEGLGHAWLNKSGQVVDQRCQGAEKRPLPIQYVNIKPDGCGSNPASSLDGHWLKDWFGG